MAEQKATVTTVGWKVIGNSKPIAVVELLADRIKTTSFYGAQAPEEALEAFETLRMNGGNADPLPFIVRVRELVFDDIADLGLYTGEEGCAIRFQYTPKKKVAQLLLQSQEEIAFGQGQEPQFARIAEVVRRAIVARGPGEGIGIKFSGIAERAKGLVKGHQKTLSSSDTEALEKLAELRAKGIITEEEFATKKKQILGI